jgi:moderate conductance mechanosensitive channel
MSSGGRVVAQPTLALGWLLLGLLYPGLAAAGAPLAGLSPPVETEVQPSMHVQVIRVLDLARDAADRRVAAIAKVPAEVARLQGDAVRSWRTGDTLRATIYCLVLLMIGGGTEWLYWAYAGKEWRRVAEAAAAGRRPLAPARAVTLGLRRAALGLAGATIFVCGALAPSSILTGPLAVQAGLVGAVLAITAVRLVGIGSVLVLSPHAARLRLIARPDRHCRRLNRAVIALSAILALGAASVSLLAGVFNAPGLAALTSMVSGIVVAGPALFVIRLLRSAAGGKPSPGAAAYPIALTVVVLLCLGLHLLGISEIVSTVLLWAAAISLGKALSAIIDAYAAGMDGATRAAEYRPVMNSGIRILVFAAATIATSAVWNIPLVQLLRSPTLIGQALARGLNIVVALLLVDLVWVWARTIIDGRLATSRLPTADGADPGARVATLLPLLRKAIFALLGLAGLITMSTLGLDIVPLLAGAGVGGIAIGLGAQTLVRDIVSGVFYLLADSFRVGEYIEFGEVRGTVEGISLRFLRVRHPRGALYTVPFGEIKWLVNLSRDWAMLKLELHVPFETDLLLVGRIVEKIGAELAEHPEFGRNMIEPLESRGIVRMEESAMVFGVKCKTKPNTGQFDIRREAYHRIRDALDEHGIRVVRRNGRPEPQDEHGTPGTGPEGMSVHEMSEVLHEATREITSAHSATRSA